jgi:hypothetical protein
MGLYIALAGVAGVALALVVVRFARRAPAGKEAFYHMPCPKCGRKLRYKPEQVGHKGMCRRCWAQFLFPDVEAAKYLSRRAK